MPDVTYGIIDEMEPIYGCLARRARAELGVTARGVQARTPPNRDSYPDQDHDETTEEVGQEEVYPPLTPGFTGDATRR